MPTQSPTMPDSADARRLVDARNLYCPEPVMLLHNAVRDVDAGRLIELLATDPSTRRDVPKFCHFLSHELVEQTQDGDVFRYVIKTRSAS
ncbi:MAG TPA: sulfurtransferase TusA [Pseudomonadales bacterium]|nr:sulfurtransferase TusA [Pseudomonadales bacterium]